MMRSMASVASSLPTPPACGTSILWVIPKTVSYQETLVSASVRRTIRMPPARIMGELPRIRLERGTRSVAGVAEFFGRPHELELVRGALARARRERRPTAVVVDGEPGVGKSRLIDEASRNVRAT